MATLKHDIFKDRWNQTQREEARFHLERLLQKKTQEKKEQIELEKRYQQIPDYGIF